MKATVFLVICLFVIHVMGDVYLHNPRGSNNRLNGEGANVQNNKRLCDTQNNNKGGYCWGPPLHYYEGSTLMIEWTNQHACNNPKVHCNVVLQYMCGKEVRDGGTTETIPDNEEEYNTQVNPHPLTGEEDDDQYLYGMHEDYYYYQNCKARERNKGLFTADQNLNNKDSAIYTRQDRNGQRHGFECNEERDYYPYWHPTPWKDIAVLVDNKDMCPYFQKESQNVKPKNYCDLPEYNNQKSCVENDGNWMKQSSWKIDPPACEESQWTRSNHLGNSAMHNDHQGYASSYNWTIPSDFHEQCTLRIRYNISTGDYEGWGMNGQHFVNASFNGAASPVRQDEKVEYFGNTYELALNTDQTGRTFQDRTHTFAIRQRPDDIDEDARIWNLNVRGKRGNIVQVYPAVEYDFVPNRLETKVGDYIHYQWTGCDYNPAGNDGEGTKQTDRSNIAQMETQRKSKPWNEPEHSMFDDKKLQQRMAFIDQVNCASEEVDDEDVTNCQKLNANPTPYFNGGIYRVNKTGEWHYMCTRNNNFSNRSQKGYIIADDSFPWWAIVLIVLSLASLAVIVVIASVAFYSKTHPDSSLGRKFVKV